MRNKGAVFALFCIAAIILLAILGPMMTGYTYSGQIIAQQNLAPRVPGLENLGIFNGDLTLKTTTGILCRTDTWKKALRTFTIGSAPIRWAAIFGPVPGPVPAFRCISHW